MSKLTIGKLAAAADVNVETIRYYQRRGLLSEPAKPQDGHRHYTANDVMRVRFIKRAQTLGFTLSDIVGLLNLNEGCVCTETRALAVSKLALINQKIGDLATMQNMLGALIQRCDSGTGNLSCPIITSLEQD